MATIGNIIKQKTSTIDYLEKTIEIIAVENNLETMGWYQAKPSIKTVKAIIANVDFNPHNLKSLSYNAKAVSSLVYDKSYVAGCALDGNINTGWVSKGKNGYLNVSYQDVEKPIKKIYSTNKKAFQNIIILHLATMICLSIKWRIRETQRFVLIQIVLLIVNQKNRSKNGWN